MNNNTTSGAVVNEAPAPTQEWKQIDIPVTVDKAGRVVEVDLSNGTATLSIGPYAVLCDPWTYLTADEARSVADALNRVADLIDMDRDAIDLLAAMDADDIDPADLDRYGFKRYNAALGQLFDPSREADHEDFGERIAARVAELQAEEAA